MTHDQLLVLDTIVAAGSFRAAAERLHRAQSAVSYAIRELEESLGVAVFDRSTYRPTLTPAGQAIHRKARVVLAEFVELRQLASRLADGEEPLIRLDITPIFPVEPVLAILRDLGKQFPQTRLQMTMEVFGGEALVAADDVDLAVADVFQRITDLEVIDLPKIPLIPVVATDHPLGRGRRTVARGDLLDYVQVVISSSSERLQETSAGVVQGAPRWNVNDFPTKLKLLVAGMGWGFMPDYMVAETVQSGALRVLKLPQFPPQAAQIGIVRKRNKVHGPVAVALWNRLRAYADGLGPDK